jgi:hypothetical protein
MTNSTDTLGLKGLDESAVAGLSEALGDPDWLRQRRRRRP